MNTINDTTDFNTYTQSIGWNQNEKMFLKILSWSKWNPSIAIEFLQEQIKINNKEIKNLYWKNPLNFTYIIKLRDEIKTYTGALDYWITYEKWKIL